MAGRSVAGIARGMTSLGVVLGLLAFAPGASAVPVPPVHFGVIGSLHKEGPADLGVAVLQGSRAAELAVNEGGGILGRGLVLDPMNDDGEVEDAGPMVNSLIGLDHAAVIIGPTTTAEYLATRPIFTQYQIPDLMQGPDAALDHETNPYFWRDLPSVTVPSVAVALYARRLGYAQAAIMMTEDQPTQDFKGPLVQAFQKLGGAIVADVAIRPGQTSYRTEALAVINAHPQVIFTETDPVSAAAIFDSFRELNQLAIPFIGTPATASDDYLRTITYQGAHDHLTSVLGAPLPDRAGFQQYYHRLYPDRQPPATAPHAYDAVISAALAIGQAGSTDGPKINAAMMAVTNPPGTPCSLYADCLTLLRAGTKITYAGASGNLYYNRYHNVFGVYGALRVDPTGQLQWVAVMRDLELDKAAP